MAMRIEKVKIEPNIVCACITGIDIDAIKPGLADYAKFPVETYVNLKRRDEAWSMTYDFPNRFLETLSEQDQLDIAAVMVMMNYDVIQFFQLNQGMYAGKLEEMIRGLSGLLWKLDKKIDLCGKLKQFIFKNVPIGDFSEAGTHPQDSEKLTFREPEVVDILTIVMLCKLMSPVFGVIAGKLKLSDSVDSKKKEIPCADILTDVLQDRYVMLIDKLQNYIRHAVKNGMDASETAAFNGYTANTIAHGMLSILLVRSFINCDLMRKNSNIMTFIITVIKSSLTAKNSGISEAPVLQRKLDLDGDEEDNTAQLDLDSSISLKPADTLAIIRAGVKPTIDIFLTNEIDPDPTTLKFNRAEYYKNRDYLTKVEFNPNPLNSLLSCGYFGAMMGGGKSVQSLYIKEYTELVALLQMILFSQGHIELGHLLTAKAVGEMDINEATISMKFKYRNSYAYMNCRNTYDMLAGCGDRWDKAIDKIVEDLCSTKYVYNTPLEIWKSLGEDSRNREPIVVPNTIIQDLCSFIEGYIRG